MNYELVSTLILSGIAILWLILMNNKRRRWLRRHNITPLLNLPEKVQLITTIASYLIAFAPAIWFINNQAWADLLMWLAGLFIIGWLLVEILSPTAK